MSTITKEFTKEQLQQIIETDHVQCGEASALARIALASLESEAGEYLTHVVDDGYGEFSDRMNFSLPVGTKLYAAPPAPVSVPDAIEPTVESIKRILPTSNPDEYAACIGADMWNACRAAMLQGADGKSQDGWVACSERMPREVLAALQNIARLRRNLNDFCGDKSVIAKCLIEAEEALLNAVNRHSTMLAEAPQQEVK